MRTTLRPQPDESTALDELRREVAALRAGQQSLELLLDGTGRGMARMPQPVHLNRLATEIAAITGGDDAAKKAARRDVGAAFRVLVALESLGVGRVAGGTMNICGKLATIPLLRPPSNELLEIGTLYGMFAAGLLRMFERAGVDPALTIVDPLVGYQHQGGRTLGSDPSGTPVREAAVRTNLGLAGAAGAATRIVTGYSTDPQLQAQVGDRRYGAIVVDGDHSREGVAADLEWVETIAAPGAIVVLDDFGDENWPGVQTALEDHLRGTTRLTLLSRVATSGFLRAS